MSARGYTEDELIEQPAIELFRKLGWEAANCYEEALGVGGTLGREDRGEVVLVSRLMPALKWLNPELPREALHLAKDEILRDRSALTMVQANHEIYDLLKDGVKVAFFDEEGHEREEKVRLVDWTSPENNDFFLASQLWVAGDMYTRRTDLVGFVNGLPLLFIELKASHKRLEYAFNHNLRDYKNTIPKLFWCNAFIILSNGSKSRIGTITSAWEHFAEWKKINSEGEEGRVSLETMIRGTCEPSRLLDIVENFTLFSEAKEGVAKLVAKNHQYFGVNNAIASVREMGENRGRLGVFWHTQGSGKSFSMVFFAQKILRTVAGNWTFLVVTDRQELDQQIYKNFAKVGAITEAEAQATSSEHLKQLLGEDHRYVFTLIQKFRTDKGATYPLLSDRSDIIVITDEAHRSQYDVFALNMRNALPNAAFIGFTGTPLMVGEEKTREVFGDYVSIYNFRQSVDDGATVRLYYENRIPELQLKDEELFQAEMERILDEAMLDEAQEKKLERDFARQYHLVTREDRLEKIAEDIVTHYMVRGHQGKAMVVSIDKATAVRMYDKVQAHWRAHLERLKSRLQSARDYEFEELKEQIEFMESTDMAVVVSQAQNEVEDMAAKGLDIKRHRERMLREDLEQKFIDADDPFRIVFVCAMWLTGFDAPACSTIYLDKPMRNHTLMQTIARANRVFGNKENGLIVDYVGIFRNLEKALAIYGSGAGGGVEPGDSPIADKEELVEHLMRVIDETTAFLGGLSVDAGKIIEASGFDRVRLLDDAVEAILADDETKKRYLSLAGLVTRLYKAILPDPRANEFNQKRVLFAVLAEKIYILAPTVDVYVITEAIDKLLDRSVAAEGYQIAEDPAQIVSDRAMDLSQIDFTSLEKKFVTGRKRTEAEKLKAMLSQHVQDLFQQNRTRADFLAKLQRMIDDYNSGAANIEDFFNNLMEFAKSLREEERRHMAEQLSEEELAIFDLLTKPDIALTEKERKQVKKVAKELLEKLKQEKLVLDWRKRQQSKAAVKLTIEEMLDLLPRTYSPELYQHKCDVVYQHVYESYYGQGRSVYAG